MDISNKFSAHWPYAHKEIVIALAAAGMMAITLPATADVNNYAEINTDLPNGHDIAYGGQGQAYTASNQIHTAAGNNHIRSSQGDAIALQSAGSNATTRFTSAGPMTASTGATNMSVLFVVSKQPTMNQTTQFISNGAFTGTADGVGGSIVHLDGLGASVAFHGVTTLDLQHGALNAVGLSVVRDSQLTSDNSLMLTTNDADGIHVNNRGTVSLTGHATITANGAGTSGSGEAIGVSVGRGGQFTFSGDPSSSITSQGVGVLVGSNDGDPAQTGATANISGVTINTAGAAADALQVDTAGINATVTAANVTLDTQGGNAAGVHMAATSTASAQATLTNATITTGGANAYGIHAQGQGAASVGGSITTTGSGAHGVELNANYQPTQTNVTLGNLNVKTHGDGAYGLDLRQGKIAVNSGVTIETFGDNADGVVYEPAGSVRASVDPGVTITTHGANANGFSVRGTGANFTFDGSGLSPGNIHVEGNGGALIEAQDGGTAVIKGSAQFAAAAGTTLAPEGADPSVWGVKAGNNGTIEFQDAATTNGNGAWAANGGTLRFKDASSAANSVVRVDSSATLDATAHAGALAVGYLEGQGTVQMGGNDLQLGGSQSMAGAYTFSGRINGTGNLVKSGANTQILSGDNAFAFTGDVFANGGVIEVTNLSDPSTFVKTFHIGNGWVDLSGTTATFDPSNPGSAANWNGIHFVDQGGSGGVIGANDKITLNTAGTYGFHIGSGSNPNGQGIYVDKTGANTVTLTGNNDYVGSTWIEDGILQVSTDANLGDTTIDREVKLMGGALQISGNFNSHRVAELYHDGSIIVDQGYDATMGGVTDFGNGYVFTKDGGGNLTLDGAELSAGAVVTGGGLTIKGGIIAAGAHGPAFSAAGGSTVDVSGMMVSSDTDVYQQTSAGHNTFHAAGSLLKGDMVADGAGAVTDTTLSNTEFKGATHGTNGGEINLTLADQDTLWDMTISSNVNQLVNNGVIALSAAVGENNILTAKDLSGSGKFVEHVNFLSGETDKLVVTNRLTGHFVLEVPASGTGNAAVDHILVVDGPANASGDFSLAGGHVDAGIYQYGLQKSGDDWELVRTNTLSNSADAALSFTHVAPTVWYGEASTLAQRMGVLKNDPGHRDGIWVQNYNRRYSLDPSAGFAYHQNQNGVMIGADQRFETRSGTWYVGGMVGYGHSSLAFPGASTGAVDSFTVGGYASWLAENGNYADLTLRLNQFTDMATVQMNGGGSGDTTHHNYGIGATAEFGRKLPLSGSAYVQPYAQLALFHADSVNYSLSNGMQVQQDALNSVQTQLGVLWGGTYDLPSKGTVSPYLKLAIATEMASNTQTTINQSPFTSNVNGSRGIVGGGISAQINNRLQLNFAAEYSKGPRIEQPFGIDFGLRYLW